MYRRTQNTIKTLLFGNYSKTFINTAIVLKYIEKYSKFVKLYVILDILPTEMLRNIFSCAIIYLLMHQILMHCLVET